MVGYRVANRTNSNLLTSDGVGVLYRWETNTSRLDSNLIYGFIYNLIPTANLRPMAENVIHFQVTPESTNKFPSSVYIEFIVTDKKVVTVANQFVDPRPYLSTNMETSYVTRMVVPIKSRER